MNQQILEQKKQLVNEIAEKIDNAASTVIVEYRGLKVKEVTELRRLLREEDCEFIVYKNTMVQRASEKLGYDELLESLTGPNAVAMSADAVAPARVLHKFARKHDKLVIKAGIVDKRFVNADELKALSKLPNKDGMIAMLLGCLQSPIRSFAATVKAIADKEENPATEPAAE
ncbi:MAG: 50S ribosomal protein L10 [Bacillota bacterium]|jgi:large subunit ribosomal protein L10|nr:50S ribosomal protein L10 [Bacillota bacterium]NLL26070.1 50S ribosomal protein L10 [Erysipelotrichia bacterium]